MWVTCLTNVSVEISRIFEGRSNKEITVALENDERGRSTITA